jgi:hypothetical protein
MFDVPKLAKVNVCSEVYTYTYISWRQAANGAKVVVKAGIDTGEAVRCRRAGADVNVADA